MSRPSELAAGQRDAGKGTNEARRPESSLEADVSEVGVVIASIDPPVFEHEIFKHADVTQKGHPPP
jgi:hypothetical protein